MNEISYVLIIFACLIISAFFSGSETALLRLTKDKIDDEVEKSGRLSAMAARELVNSPAKLLVTILLGNNVVNILGAASASALGVHYLGEQRGLLVSTVAMTLVVLIFSEILPKSVAAKNPEKVSFFVSLPLYIIHKVSAPLHFLYERTIEPLVHLIAGKQSEGTQTSTAESILKLAEGLSARKNDGTPIPIIGSAAAAGSLFAEDILISRSEIFFLDCSISLEEAEKRLGDSRYTRAVVCDGTLENIIGTVHLKDLVRVKNSESSVKKDLKSLVKPVLFVPSKIPILAVLPKMQKGLIHTAIVQDAFGVTKGMLTQEDILEEIVGEIRDEFDSDELRRINKVAAGKYQVLGTVTIHDFSKESGWELPGERGESIGELVFTALGRTPKRNDQVILEGYVFRVLEVTGQRTVRFEVSRAEE